MRPRFRISQLAVGVNLLLFACAHNADTWMIQANRYATIRRVLATDPPDSRWWLSEMQHTQETLKRTPPSPVDLNRALISESLFERRAALVVLAWSRVRNPAAQHRLIASLEEEDRELRVLAALALEIRCTALTNEQLTSIAAAAAAEQDEEVLVTLLPCLGARGFDVPVTVLSEQFRRSGMLGRSAIAHYAASIPPPKRDVLMQQLRERIPTGDFAQFQKLFHARLAKMNGS